MSQSSRNKAGRPAATAEAGISIARTTIAALVVVVGIAWIAVYLNVAKDGSSLSWMGDLGRWNFLIGFALVFLGLALAANPATPLGRGRGVVVGIGFMAVGFVYATRWE